MVDNESRNNLIVTAVIIAIGVMTVFSMSQFLKEMNTTSESTQEVVQTTAQDINGTMATLIGTIQDLTDLKSQELSTFRDGFNNLSTVINQELSLLTAEKEQSEKDLVTFMGTFQNQSDTQVKAIDELKNAFTETTNNQTSEFVQTLSLSQNLTKESQNLTQYRNALEENRTSQLDDLIRLFNLTLTPVVSDVLVNKQNISSTAQSIQ